METVVLTLAAGTLYQLGTPSAATVTITEPQIVTVQVIDDAAADGGSDAAILRFTRTGDASGQLSVGRTVGGTSINGVDFPGFFGVFVVEAVGDRERRRRLRAPAPRPRPSTSPSCPLTMPRRIA